MQHNLKRTFLAVSLSLAIAPVAYATNGMAPTGIGQIHKAMGGAAVANPENTTSIATNPASVTAISNGYDVELELFAPNRTVYKKAELGAAKYNGNADSLFFIPGGGYKKSINEKLSFGVAVYGNGGMNTKFKNGPEMPNNLGGVVPFSASGAKSGINLEQLFIAPTLGVKLNDKHSIGISANVIYQTFKAYGIGNLAGFSADGAHFSGNGKASATGIGATVGWLGQINDEFSVGASYRMKTKMSRFKEYAGLFPDQGRMDVPAALTVGVSGQVSPKTKIAFDIQQIYYADTRAVGNASNKTDKNGNPMPFGSNNGPGFGWNNQTVFKFGIKHQKSPRLALMGGFNYGDSAVGSDSTFFGSLAPGVVEAHASLGFEYKLNKTSKLLGSYRHAFSNKVKGDLSQGQFLDLEMEQNAIGIGYSKQF